MNFALAQICTLSTPFAEECEQFAAAGFSHIEAWFTKLENYLQSHTLADAQALLHQHHLQIPVAAMQGGLFAPSSEATQLAWSLLEQRLRLCQALKIGTFIIACDVTDRPSPSVVQRVEKTLDQLGVWADRFEVQFALEFQASASLGNNLQTMTALVHQADHPRLGICLDAFHFHVGPSMLQDLGELDPRKLLHVQLSDLAGQPRELARDSHRILPGDGDLPLDALVNYLRTIDYQGIVSIELMNPQIAAIDARSVAEISLAALKRTCSPQ